MISRRDVLSFGAGLWLFAVPLASLAQQRGKVWRIGVLDTTSATLNATNLDAFRQGLRELGYVEGENLVIEYRSADGRDERFQDLANDLVRLKIDLIVTRGTPAVLAAKNSTTMIPVVMAAIAEPLLAVASLARPGRNVTGLSALTSDLETKRVELLREMVPGLARIAALYNMNNPVFGPRWKELQTVAKSVGFQPQLLDVRKPDDIERAFDAARTQRVNALIVGTDGLLQANRRLIADLAAKHRLPAIYVSMEFVEAGGLMAYGPSFSDLYRRAATYVDKILKGAKPADLPVEQPTKFELVINMKAAKALGIKIPQSILVRADRVIE